MISASDPVSPAIRPYRRARNRYTAAAVADVSTIGPNRYEVNGSAHPRDVHQPARPSRA